MKRKLTKSIDARRVWPLLSWIRCLSCKQEFRFVTMWEVNPNRWSLWGSNDDKYHICTECKNEIERPDPPKASEVTPPGDE